MSTNPLLVHDSSGYKMTDEDISLWRNVEHVMTTAFLALQAGRTFPLEHEQPPPPSHYGYTRAHSQEKFAKNSVMKSLNAFQRLLAYCSYSLAGRHWSSSTPEIVHSGLESTFSIVYTRLDPNMRSAHVVVKDLFWTLSEIHTTQNFTGIVVRWTKQYDFPALHSMRMHKVPVYVAWPTLVSDQIPNPYQSLHQGYYTTPWIPSPQLADSFRQALHSPEPVDPLPNLSLPSTAKSQRTYDDPMDYIKLRLEKIPTELHDSPNKQTMLDRDRSAKSFKSLGSAKFYKFEESTVVNEQTGERRVSWIRELLTKHYAQEEFQSCDNSELW